MSGIALVASIVAIVLTGWAAAFRGVPAGLLVSRAAGPVSSGSWTTYDLPKPGLCISLPTDWTILWHNATPSGTAGAPAVRSASVAVPDLSDCILLAAYAADCECDGDLFAYLTVSCRKDREDGGPAVNLAARGPEVIRRPAAENSSDVFGYRYEVQRKPHHWSLDFTTNSRSPERAVHVFDGIVASIRSNSSLAGGPVPRPRRGDRE